MRKLTWLSVALIVASTAACDTGSRHSYKGSLGSGSTAGSGTDGVTGTPNGNGGLSLGSATPNTGSTLGGTSVTLGGTGFVAGTQVFFGSTAGTNVLVASATQLTVESPAHTAGLVDITVQTPAGFFARLNNAFNFDPNAGGGPLARVGDYGNPTGEEQELLELMNRARRNPTAEGNRVGLDLSAYPVRPPLSANGFLTQAATGHTNDEIARNFYGHTNPDGLAPNGRILNTNYDLHGSFGTRTDVNLTENIGVGAGNQFNSPQAVHNSFVIDAGLTPPKHRDAMLGLGTQLGANREVGFGVKLNQTANPTPATDLSFSPNHWVTEEFARTKRDRALITGVVHNDDGDGVARNGEGRGGVTVTLSHVSGFTLTTQTASAGGYVFETFVDTDFTITIEGQSTTVTIANGNNVKVDLVNGAIRTY